MRIAMMGSGGIGGYLGARLDEGGEDVVFIARGAHLEAMRRSGLRLKSQVGDTVLGRVRATETPAEIGAVDIVIFAVKLYDTESAAAAMVPLVGPATRVVTLQNGMTVSIRWLVLCRVPRLLGALLICRLAWSSLA
jgi:2-dehydropantoate 2-reductase